MPLDTTTQTREAIQAELAKLKPAQRKAMRGQFSSVISALNIRAHDAGAEVEVAFAPTNGRRLWAYAYLGPRGRVCDLQTHVTAEDGMSSLFSGRVS